VTSSEKFILFLIIGHELKSWRPVSETNEVIVLSPECRDEIPQLVIPCAGGGFVSIVVRPPEKPPYSELSGKLYTVMDSMTSTGMGIEKLPETGSTFSAESTTSIPWLSAWPLNVSLPVEVRMTPESKTKPL